MCHQIELLYGRQSLPALLYIDFFGQLFLNIPKKVVYTINNNKIEIKTKQQNDFEIEAKKKFKFCEIVI